MSQTERENIRQISDNLELARHWGTEGETVLRAMEIMRNNPRIATVDALRDGLEQSKESMEPMNADK